MTNDASNKPRKGLLVRLTNALASFELSVSILMFLMVITFFGTLAQVDHGLYVAQKMYFESWFVSQPLWLLSLPLPGGQLLMAALAVNLFFGGLFRIRKNTRTAGIIVVHIGIVVLLVSSLVKHRFSEDGRLTLYEGESGAEFIHYHDWEIAIHEVGPTENVKEWLIADEDIEVLKGDLERKVNSPDLPMELTIRGFVENATVVRAREGMRTALPVVDGYTVVPQDRNTQNQLNVAAIYVSILDRATGSIQDGILWGQDSYPLVVEAGGKQWSIRLRHERFEMPFGIELVDFKKEDHARMRMAASYSSDVLRIEGEERTPVHIRMNEPLRHEGMILFQSGWGPQDAPPGTPLFSTFSVVRNPSDQWPLISCIIIGLGMLIAFAIRLIGFIGKQMRARRDETQGQGA